jgi:hypothetical protein
MWGQRNEYETKGDNGIHEEEEEELTEFSLCKLLARSQYPEGPATGHLDTGFS